MELSEQILTKLGYENRGKKNAIKRRDLLHYAQHYNPYITDRQLRNIYCQLPVVTCDKGIFYPIRTSEVQEFREYLRKKAIPLFERWKRVADVHLKGEQMELF